MATTETLAEKADRLYRFIHTFLKENAKPPSHKEMAEGCQISRETVVRCIDELKRQGRDITQVKRRHRQVWVPIREMREED